MNNSIALFRFSEGHSATQLSYLCGILLNCAGMSQARALDPITALPLPFFRMEFHILALVFYW